MSLPAQAEIGWANPKNLAKRSYLVYFLCQHTCTAVEPLIKISVTCNWLIGAALILKLGLIALKLALHAYALPFPIPNVPLVEQIKTSEFFVSSFGHGNLGQE